MKQTVKLLDLLEAVNHLMVTFPTATQTYPELYHYHQLLETMTLNNPEVSINKMTFISPTTNEEKKRHLDLLQRYNPVYRTLGFDSLVEFKFTDSIDTDEPDTNFLNVAAIKLIDGYIFSGKFKHEDGTFILSDDTGYISTLVGQSSGLKGRFPGVLSKRLKEASEGNHTALLLNNSDMGKNPKYREFKSIPEVISHLCQSVHTSDTLEETCLKFYKEKCLDKSGDTATYLTTLFEVLDLLYASSLPEFAPRIMKRAMVTSLAARMVSNKADLFLQTHACESLDYTLHRKFNGLEFSQYLESILNLVGRSTLFAYLKRFYMHDDHVHPGKADYADINVYTKFNNSSNYIYGLEPINENAKAQLDFYLASNFPKNIAMIKLIIQIVSRTITDTLEGR